MSNKVSYFLPIDSVNLSSYVRSTMIAPIYNRSNQDSVQGSHKNHLLLSSATFVNKSDCSLELVLKEEEVNSLHTLEDNIFLLDKPLPFSRVKKVHFTSEKQKKATCTNINVSVAFFPLNLTTISSNRIHFDLLNSKFNNKNKAFNFNTKINLYNKILGGFAILKTVTPNEEEYASDFLSLFAEINNIVKKQLESVNFIFSKNLLSFLEFNSKLNILEAIYKNEIDKILKHYSAIEHISIKHKASVITLDSIREDSNTYILAILKLYGKSGGSKKSLDNFFQDLKEKFPDKRKEGIAFCFGIKEGYNIFNKKHTSYGVYPKLKLNTKFDYYLLESIYEYVFNDNKTNSDFSYIDEWYPSNNTRNILPSNAFSVIQILDKEVLIKKKEIRTKETIVGQKELSSSSKEHSVQKTETSQVSDFEKILSKLEGLFDKGIIKFLHDFVIEFSNIKNLNERNELEIKDLKIENKKHSDKINNFNEDYSKLKNENEKYLKKIQNLNEEHLEMDKEIKGLRKMLNISIPSDESPIIKERTNTVIKENTQLNMPLGDDTKSESINYKNITSMTKLKKYAKECGVPVGKLKNFKNMNDHAENVYTLIEERTKQFINKNRN